LPNKQDDVKSAIEELRSLAHGIYPPLLSNAGLAVAMSAACRRAPLPASLEADGVGRHAPEIEAAVYFCCLEALQNSAKYAGAAASARVRIWEDAGGLLFEVSDDGAGFEAGKQPQGAGLTNMRDRLGAVGGTLRVESGGGHGTMIHGVVPVSGTVQD
jgi:signal transduction histidine kinase